MDEGEEIRFIDLFAGIGGFHLGLEEANRSNANQNRTRKTGAEAEPASGKGHDPVERDGSISKRGTDGMRSFDGSSEGQSSGFSSKQLQSHNGEGGNQKEASDEYSSFSTGSVRSHSGELHSGGFQCVWANEWDKYAASIYRKRFPETPLSTNDIRKVNADDIPDHDLLCAGFPCQAFSVAGRRRGFEDTRGTLFYEIARIAERKRPHLLLLENVKGLLSHDKGQTFGTILEVLGSLGYWCEWQVLNSKWFGVPQNRERVFIIGHIGEEPARTIFPITETGGESNIGDSEKQVASTLQSPGHANENYRGMNMVQVGNLYENKADAGRVYSTDGVARTLKGESGGVGGKMGLYQVQPLKFLNRNQKNFGNEAMTVDTANSTGIKEGSRIRRLTPLECERLQGFPDFWTEGISDTQRYKCLGNAVTVNVVRFLGERISQLAGVDIPRVKVKEAEVGG